MAAEVYEQVDKHRQAVKRIKTLEESLKLQESLLNAYLDFYRRNSEENKEDLNAFNAQARLLNERVSDHFFLTHGYEMEAMELAVQEFNLMEDPTFVTLTKDFQQKMQAMQSEMGVQKQSGG